MNYGRILLAAAAAAIVFFIYGFLVHGLLIAKDYIPYPEGVHRGGEAARSHTPFALAGIFIAILVFATIYAMDYQRRAGVSAGARLGLLFGIFMAGAFVAVNYATINIGEKLALEIGTSELVEWTLVGTMVGRVYKPSAAS